MSTTNKAKRVINSLIGEDEAIDLDHAKYVQNIFDITKHLVARLNYFMCYDIGGGGEDSATFQYAIEDWLSYARNLLSTRHNLTRSILMGDPFDDDSKTAFGGLNSVELSLNHHMDHGSSDCMYNISEPWAEFLRGDKDLPQLHKPGQGRKAFPPYFVGDWTGVWDGDSDLQE